MSEMDFSQSAAEGLRAILDEAAKEIAKKHNLGSVALFVTFNDEDSKTRMVHARAGNYYASFGAVRQWIVYEDAIEGEQARRAITDRDA